MEAEDYRELKKKFYQFNHLQDLVREMAKNCRNEKYENIRIRCSDGELRLNQVIALLILPELRSVDNVTNQDVILLPDINIQEIHSRMQNLFQSMNQHCDSKIHQINSEGFFYPFWPPTNNHYPFSPVSSRQYQTPFTLQQTSSDGPLEWSAHEGMNQGISQMTTNVEKIIDEELESSDIMFFQEHELTGHQNREETQNLRLQKMMDFSQPSLGKLRKEKVHYKLRDHTSGRNSKTIERSIHQDERSQTVDSDVAFENDLGDLPLTFPLQHETHQVEQRPSAMKDYQHQSEDLVDWQQMYTQPMHLQSTLRSADQIRNSSADIQEQLAKASIQEQLEQSSVQLEQQSSAHLEQSSAQLEQHSSAHLEQSSAHLEQSSAQLEQSSAHLEQSSVQLEQHSSAQLQQSSAQLQQQLEATSQAHLQVEGDPRYLPSMQTNGQKINGEKKKNNRKSLAREKSIQCEVCQQVFSSKQNLNRHIRCKHEKEMQVCPVCQKEVRKDNFYQHKKLHSEAKFTCKECWKTFPRQTYLKNHMKIHTGERNFMCPMEGCEKSFCMRGELNRHIKIHQPRQHKCEICDKEFVSNVKLQRHMKCHQDDKDYKCENCGSSFNRIDNLKKHYNKAHGIVLSDLRQRASRAGQHSATIK